jgi:hypothetical protein
MSLGEAHIAIARPSCSNRSGTFWPGVKPLFGLRTARYNINPSVVGRLSLSLLSLTEYVSPLLAVRRSVRGV